jgi:hypothetical protein
MDQGQTNTPHPCVQHKEKGRKCGIPTEFGSRPQPKMTRTYVQEQSHEIVEEDADQRCISVKYFRDCGKRKKKRGLKNSRKSPLPSDQEQLRE